LFLKAGRVERALLGMVADLCLPFHGVIFVVRIVFWRIFVLCNALLKPEIPATLLCRRSYDVNTAAHDQPGCDFYQSFRGCSTPLERVKKKTIKNVAIHLEREEVGRRFPSMLPGRAETPCCPFAPHPFGPFL
jgi:hypothetical protein